MATKETKQPPSEIVIMARLDRILSAMDAQARVRIMAWLADKHGHATPSQSTVTNCRAVPITTSREKTLVERGVPMPF